MFALQCPDCGEETKMSMLNSRYLGPFVCWACRARFTVVIQDGELQSAEHAGD